MSKWTNLYRGNEGTSLYTGGVSTGIDLRKEFTDLILGRNGDPKIGQKFILRRMRRDSDDNLVECYCMNETTKEPSWDYPCSSCYGAGYLFDEEIVTGYKIISSSASNASTSSNLPKSEAGVAYLPSATFYFRYDLNLKREDRIVEIKLDESGQPITPYSRVRIFEIALVTAMRSDNGKIDFWVAKTQTLGPQTKGTVS